MSDAKAAIDCISLFNLHVTVLREIIFCIGKALGGGFVVVLASMIHFH